MSGSEGKARGSKRPARKRREQPRPPATAAASVRALCWPAGLTLFVCGVVLVAHWPVLSAQALSFDDGQFLTDNPLVRNPSWASAGRFLAEVLEPSTVEGYYLPLSMISLMPSTISL